MVAPRKPQDAATRYGGHRCPALQKSTTGAAVFFLEGVTMFSWQLVDGPHGYFFRLRAANGNIICTSEIYSSREAAEDTLKSLAGWFGDCAVIWNLVTES